LLLIRGYRESDAESAGNLIADTYTEFNLNTLPSLEVGKFLGPFRNARSQDPAHQEAIARVIRSAMVYVAEADGEIVGILRGRIDRLASLFVRGDHHRQGIARRLVEQFELECLQRGSTVIRVSSTQFAVPFYLAMGYQRSTGVRNGRSFEGHGLKVQPMRKVFNKTG
jgi:GNAT superfamily N-acetyltransferase